MSAKGQASAAAETDYLAAERDAKFKKWLQNKTLRDKTFDYLGQLDNERAKDRESLKQVAVSLCAIDRLLGTDDSSTSRGDNDENDAENEGPAPPKNDANKPKSKEKTMRGAWTKWAMDNHTFDSVSISASDASQLTKGALENLDPVEGGGFVVPSLKCFFAEEAKKPGDKTRPLTNDQKVFNSFFMRESRKLWKEAKLSLSEQVKDFVNSGGRPVATSSSSSQDKAKGQGASEEKGGSSSSSSGAGSKAAKAETDGAPQAGSQGGSQAGSQSQGAMLSAKLELRALNDLSLKRLRDWIEEDEDKASEAKADKRRQDLSEAKKQHEIFVRQKEEEDERKRQALREERNGEDAVRRREAEKNAKEHTRKAFEEWVIQKEMRESALKCLGLLACPGGPEKDKGLERTSLTRASTASTKPAPAPTLTSLNALIGTRDLGKIIEIGRALKKIDRTLLPDWARWCDKIVPFNTASVFWDAFEPISCDVHSPTSSAVKDAFLKILRPGVDYKATFVEYAERLMRASGKLDGMDKEEKAKALSECEVPKEKMKGLMEEMGLILKPTEFRTLIDSFDANGDGVVTVAEFLAFTGDSLEPDANQCSCSGCRRGGRAVLNSRCCWMTTCHVTGMGNAYSVSLPTKKQQRDLPGSGSRAESKDDDRSERGDRGSKADGSVAGSLAGGGSELLVVKEMANGEKRIIVELKERMQRESLLLRFGIISQGGSKVIKEESDGYGDDFEENEEDGEGDKGQLKRVYPECDKGSESRCSFSKWTNDDRKAGLEHMQKVSRSARQEEIIRNMLSNGQPPKPPKLWADKANTASDLASIEINLCWEPAKDDLVSFYSLEFAGPTGGKMADQTYQEIFRDPQDADPNASFDFGYTLRALPNNAPLLPGITYQFRLRAFNGFGPGDYTYRTFTTRTEAPPQPRVDKLTADSVTLRWAFSDTFFKRVADLKRIFEQADVDKSGLVSRTELISVLTDRADNSSSLRAFLQNKAQSLGIDLSGGLAGLFDAIETSDDAHGISWQDFEDFFLSAGWADSKAPSIAISASQASVRSSSGGAGSGGSKAGKDITYVVEQCESEFDNIYKEVLKTSASTGTIHRLDPGKSYRFRVYSVNIEGVAGPRSDSIIIHTMLETPSAPTLASLSAKSITVQWRDRKASTSTRDPATIQRMLHDWAGTHGENDGGVSIEAAFAKYDRDGSGDIDAAELALMLQDLGVETTEERLREAFDLLDTNGDGIISFEEFSVWWRRDDVSYVLKRSEPVVAIKQDLRASTSSLASVRTSTQRDGGGAGGRQMQKMAGIPEDRSVAGSIGSRTAANLAANAAAAASGGRNKLSVAFPIVSYRGAKNRTDIAGLEPNRYYHFKLRYHGSKCSSNLSPSLAVMTAPLPPSAPLLLDVSATATRVKWYPGANGAFKFLVQLRNKSNRKAVAQALGDPAPGAADGWTVVFNGQETLWTSTTMVPDSSYEVRVLALNCQGTMSEPSATLAFSTLARDQTRDNVGPRSADSVFTIECTGDICVGDMLLITERLFAKEDAGANPSSSGSVSGRSRAGGAGTGASVSGHAGANASRVGGGASVRMEMSVSSQSDGGYQPGAFIGERTIACSVVRDNYRTSRDTNLANGIGPGDKRFAKGRKLWLEVVWQQASSDACKPYELKPGEVFERLQSTLEQFEVFRAPWRDEEARRGLLQEYLELKDAYQAVDCEPL